MEEADAEETEENQIEIEHVVSHCFNVGDKFSTYDELKRKITAYENNYSVQLYHSDSRTLEAANKRAPRKAREAKKDLVYYTVNLCCVFGGRKFSNKGCGKRPHQRSVRCTVVHITNNLLACRSTVHISAWLLTCNIRHVKTVLIASFHNVCVQCLCTFMYSMLYTAPSSLAAKLESS